MECICEYDGNCYGTGIIECNGCGGGICVCRSCHSHGSIDCHGCIDCNFGEFDDSDYCPHCDGIGEAACNCDEELSKPVETEASDNLCYRLEAMATEMQSVSELMRYQGGFNAEMVQHANELAGAAGIARGWADGIRDDKK